MKKDLTYVVHEAGRRILGLYGEKTFKVKEDHSPVTRADLASHHFLLKHLPEIKNLPILSEENASMFPYEIRKEWNEFWLVDPLDGTQEFINQSGHFCINIALIKNQKPVLGVIYAPLLNEFYWAEDQKGWEYKGPPRPQRQDPNILIATMGRFSKSASTREFMKLNNITTTKEIGAALKFGALALGEVDIYPRFEGSKEWDTGAGEVIIREAGCLVLDLCTKAVPSYNKPNLLNNYFIASRPHISIEKFKIPQFSFL